MNQPGHGLDEFLEKLGKIPQSVTVAVRQPKEDDSDFDRKVRRSLDRLHRRERLSQ